MTKRRHAALLWGMSALICALLLAGIGQMRRTKALAHQVNASYEKGLYESVALMNGIELNLEKLLVSQSAGQAAQLLLTIAQQAEAAQANMSALPLPPEHLTGAVKFTNQASDYAKSLETQLRSGKRFNERDINQLIAQHNTAIALNAQLFDIAGQYERGELQFDASLRTNPSSNVRTEPLVDYPVLLYDGPFSDANHQGMIQGDRIDRQAAQLRLMQYVGDGRVRDIQYIGESDIMGLCYEFEMQTDDGALIAGITQAGGHVLYMLPVDGVDGEILNQGRCIDAAHAFLQSRGYGDMEVSYWRQFAGLLTVNFAAAQDGVLMYPDLVKVQVSMETGHVVGIEAGNYLLNHRRRYLSEPMVTSDMALQQLSPLLTPERIRRCVIPIGQTEAQCWEITALIESGNRYLVYVDVLSGEERQILRVMVEQDGVLAQ